MLLYIGKKDSPGVCEDSYLCLTYIVFRETDLSLKMLGRLRTNS